MQLHKVDGRSEMVNGEGSRKSVVPLAPQVEVDRWKDDR